MKDQTDAELQKLVRKFANDTANILVDYNGLDTEEFYTAENELIASIKARDAAKERELKHELASVAIEDYDDTDPYQQGYEWMRLKAISIVSTERRESDQELKRD